MANCRFPVTVLALLAVLAASESVRAADDEALGFERTPPRLSFVEGEVSFIRSGAEDWAAGVVNTPLAAGDELYAAANANFEVQIGPRAYLRAGEETQISLATLEPDFLQISVNEGYVSLDLRTLTASQTLEVDTPKGAFTIERSGYYRIGVEEDTTSFVARRGGRASVTTTRGATTTIAASEQVVITGNDAPQLETYAAPDLDAWDRWNYARTDSQLDAVSARYVPPGVYGADDLDHHGDWRVVPNYGAIWVPRGVAAGWAPYTNGRWLYDPYYGWSWVDAAPWGWAPYHYGRWVSVSGYWAWAPGPLVVRPYYAPALVAFFGGGGVSVGISIAAPQIGWFALGWGEPIVPWWGPAGCRGVPRWGGWGGPRVVNRVVIQNKTAVHLRDIHIYENQRVRHAFVAMDRDRFGRHRVAEARLGSAEVRSFHRLEGNLDLRPTRESLAPSSRPGRRPPRNWQERAVVATRAPRPAAVPEFDSGRTTRGDLRRAAPAPDRGAHAPRVRVVEPSRSTTGRTYQRPPFGTRGEGERAAPSPPPRYERRREAQPAKRVASPPATEPAGRERATIRAPGQPSRQAPPLDSEAREQRPQELPGEPANRVYRRRSPISRPGAARAPAARVPGASDGADDSSRSGGAGAAGSGGRRGPG